MNLKQAGDSATSQEAPPVSLERLDSSMQSLRSALDKLKSKTDVLPLVEKDGSSECPFAEDLYADKEEALENAEKCLQGARGYLPLLDREITRCSRNLSTISADKGNLHDENAKDQYQSALEAQKRIYQKKVESKKELLKLLQQAEQLLSKARAKNYPGKKPEKQFRPPLPAWGGMTPVGTVSQPLEYKPAPVSRPVLAPNELNNLVSLGPLSRKFGP